MFVEEYFANNEIGPKTLEDVTAEQIAATRIRDQNAYYNAYYLAELDVLQVCLNFDLYQRFYEIVLREVKDFESLLEPWCGSGILGCFLAQETGAEYLGMEVNSGAIDKAKERARKNGLDERLFTSEDFMQQNQRFDTVIGCYALNTPYLFPSISAIEHLMGLSDNFVMIQNLPDNGTTETYKQIFERRGYHFEVLAEPEIVKGTTYKAFVFKASKN